MAATSNLSMGEELNILRPSVIQGHGRGPKLTSGFCVVASQFRLNGNFMHLDPSAIKFMK